MDRRQSKFRRRRIIYRLDDFMLTCHSSFRLMYVLATFGSLFAFVDESHHIRHHINGGSAK